MNERKTARIAVKYNLPISHILVRGGTDHRKDLLLKDGSVVHLNKDGTIKKCEIGWRNE
jgi:hypothetical protein